jgi:hypothetical protein
MGLSDTKVNFTFSGNDALSRRMTKQLQWPPPTHTTLTGFSFEILSISIKMGWVNKKSLLTTALIDSWFTIILL